MAKSLFMLEPFTSHSGVRLDWKIDCDALTEAELECIAFIIHNQFSRIKWVVGIPQGGVRLANVLRSKYVCRHSKGITLIVDDVLTTGASMEKAREAHPGASGAVIFARGPCPDWIQPVFQMAIIVI